MVKVREVIQYKNHFEKFLLSQPEKIQDKIFKVIEIIETYQHVPKTYLAPMKTHKGLYEARIKLGSNIWRVFCFFRQRKISYTLEWIHQKDTENTKKRNRQSCEINERILRRKKQIICKLKVGKI